MYIYIYIYIYIYVCMYVCMYVCVCVRVYRASLHIYDPINALRGELLDANVI